MVWVLGLQESHMIEKNTHLSCPAHSVCCLSSLYLNSKAMYLPCLHLTPTSLNGKHQRSVVGGLGLGDKPASLQPHRFLPPSQPLLGTLLTFAPAQAQCPGFCLLLSVHQGLRGEWVVQRPTLGTNGFALLRQDTQGQRLTQSSHSH